MILTSEIATQMKKVWRDGQTDDSYTGRLILISIIESKKMKFRGVNYDEKRYCNN